MFLTITLSVLWRYVISTFRGSSNMAPVLNWRTAPWRTSTARAAS